MKYLDELPNYEYKEFKYLPKREFEDDNAKICHLVRTPDEKIIDGIWSPYSVPTLEEFKQWVDSGCPEIF